MPVVTLVVASGPGFPQGSPDHRYEIGAKLTPGGYLDAKAWEADSSPWSARRIVPNSPPRLGDMVFDADTESWAIRLYPGPGEVADAPLAAQIRRAGQLRPGEYVTIQEPDGQEFSYRVVSVA